MKKHGFTVLLLILVSACSQWNVVLLRPKEYMFIKNGDSIGRVMVKTDDNGLQNLTLSLGIFNDRIGVADNELKRFQLMDSDGDTELVIGALTNIDTKKVKAVNFNFNIIGSFTIDNKGSIYIQNRLTQPRGQWGQTAGNEVDFSPSYVLVFDKKGELQYTLGQKGTPDIPFYHIETLDVDTEGRLFIISRSFDSWSVFRFSNKRRDFYVNLGHLQFVDKEENEEYQGKIENVRMYQSGDKFLISVAFYQDLRLKYCKLYDYSIEKNRVDKENMTIPDPKNVLFNIINDRQIYFWNIDNDDVRFMICNVEGMIMKNVLLKVDYKNNFFSQVLTDRSGNLYTYSVTKKGVQIFQWE